MLKKLLFSSMLPGSEQVLQVFAFSFNVPGGVTFCDTPARCLWCDLIREVFCTKVPEVGRSDNGELFNDCKRHNFFHHC